MIENTNNRWPLLLTLAGLLLLGGAALYYSKGSLSNEAKSSDNAAATKAKKAMAVAGMDAKDRAATEAVVRAYILEHPEIIPEALAVLQKRETLARLSKAGDALHTPFAGAVGGNLSGDVTIVEFTDYNCGYCLSSVADVERLVANDTGIRVVYREVPILAETSKEAALWALAAAKQGKHATFHKAMFSGAKPDTTSIRAAAMRAGMDLAAAQNFIAAPEAMAELKNNVEMMRGTGFSGTPTFIIGDEILEGAVGYEALHAAIVKARQKV
jgi:protein-disulfide isomerase